MEMGHGDELVLADGNFPAASTGRQVIRADGLPIPELLDAILDLCPLDNFVPQPVALMAVVPGHGEEPAIWQTYVEIVKKHDPHFGCFEYMERFAFYERAKQAYAVVATGETALYANIILKKGIVLD
jgi:L-fucose mutarotase